MNQFTPRLDPTHEIFPHRVYYKVVASNKINFFTRSSTAKCGIFKNLYIFWLQEGWEILGVDFVHIHT